MATGTVNHYTHRLTLEQLDALGEAAHKLHALLAHTYGNSGEAFRNLCDGLQDSYMWTCADLAGQIEDLVRKI